ncbi:unnamed protein product [Boreogadus saida]
MCSCAVPCLTVLHPLGCTAPSICSERLQTTATDLTARAPPDDRHGEHLQTTATDLTASTSRRPPRTSRRAPPDDRHGPHGEHLHHLYRNKIQSISTLEIFSPRSLRCEGPEPVSTGPDESGAPVRAGGMGFIPNRIHPDRDEFRSGMSSGAG